jgi:hypothetical protein
MNSEVDFDTLCKQQIISGKVSLCFLNGGPGETRQFCCKTCIALQAKTELDMSTPVCPLVDTWKLGVKIVLFLGKMNVRPNKMDPE